MGRPRCLPADATVRGDASSEWSQAFRASAVPDLLAALGGCDVQEILDLLQRRYASADSDKLEQLIGETEDIPDLLQRRYESTDSDDLAQLIREADTTMLRKFWPWPV